MTVDELIAHSSIQREFSWFRKLGGSITVVGNKITLSVERIIPIDIAGAYVIRIKALDTESQLEIFIEK